MLVALKNAFFIQQSSTVPGSQCSFMPTEAEAKQLNNRICPPNQNQEAERAEC
ncbi:imidazoleglycerol phosphate synthase cyclase subunit [Anopheles sinensis]|uniref:Imidazoleglycerol phosphate synthase cyclase subunit n=1 Tax=Anopheles sinensis TaxID=74873 RepID=A0A084VRM6_ANOSI|nr:imidazoleglycerol phosphate synthase cyclase subunit [Anopheles sinensis]